MILQHSSLFQNEPLGPLCYNHEKYLRSHLQNEQNHRCYKCQLLSLETTCLPPRKMKYYTFVSLICYTRRKHHQINLSYYDCLFIINSEANFPEINAGGTPGPGTVNCPVKYKFPTLLLLILGLKKAVCNKVFAIPYAFPL